MIGWYDWVASLGLTVRVTEFDIVNVDEAMYADYLRDTLIAAYSSAGADGFLMWGFTDDAHWMDSAPLFRHGWVPKPGLAVWEEWVLGQWRSTAAGVTNTTGGWADAAMHHGEYSVRVQCGTAPPKVVRARVAGPATRIAVQV
jgi:endo-1,4-beta-xylanase